MKRERIQKRAGSARGGSLLVTVIIALAVFFALAYAIDSYGQGFIGRAADFLAGENVSLSDIGLSGAENATGQAINQTENSTDTNNSLQYVGETSSASQSTDKIDFSSAVKDSKGNSLAAEIILTQSGKEVKKIKSRDNGYNETEIPSGIYDIEVVPDSGKVKKIIAHDVNTSSGISEIADIETAKSGQDFLFSVNPKINDTNFTIVAQGTPVPSGQEGFRILKKCVEWDFDTSTCNGEWVNVAAQKADGTYEFTINATDPGFMESISTCVAEDSAAVQGSFPGACDGTYPAACGVSGDLLSCNDNLNETHSMTNTGWAGLNISQFNTTITNCAGITNVSLCYEWWADATTASCTIAIDNQNGTNFTNITTTCPGTTANPGVICQDVTLNKTWTCSNFFGTSGNKSRIKSEAERSSGGAVRIMSWDVLVYNVTYNVLDTIKPVVVLNLSNDFNSSSRTINFNWTATDNIDTNLTCNLSINNVVNATNVSSLNNSVTNFTVSNFADVTGLWNVTCVDDNANFNTSATRNFTVDATFPNVTLVPPSETSGTYITRNNIIVNATAIDEHLLNVTIQLYNLTNLLINSTSSLTSPNFVNYTALGDGIYYFNATGYDTFGNKNTTETRNVTIDTIKPVITFVSPTDVSGTFVSRNYTVINVSATDANLLNITIRLYNFSNNVLLNATTTSTSPNLINYTNLADGTYLFNSTAFDRAGNSNTTETRNITVDTIKPAVSFVSPTEVAGALLTRNNIVVNATATDSNFFNLTTRLYNSTGVLINVTSGTAAFLFNNFTGLSDGIYFFNSTAYDKAGNFNVTETRNATIDTTAPVINFVPPTETSGTFISRNNIVTNVTASDASLLNITRRIYNSAGSLVNVTNSSTSPLFSNITGFADGLYYFNATAYDSLGNSNTTETRNVTIDTVKPAINFENPTEASGAFITRNNIVINTTASDSNLVNVTNYLYNSSNVLINTTTTSTSPNFINYTSLADGIYYFNSTAFDRAGNVNSTETRNVTIDTLKPAITFVSPTETSGSSINRNNIVINATATDANLLNTTIYLYNSTGGLRNSTTTLTSPNFVNYTGLSEGLYFFNATAYDSAGNFNFTEKRNVTIDTSAPVWSNPSVNETVVYWNSSVKFNATWTNAALSGYIFSTNMSGSWVNTSFIPFGGTINYSTNISTITANASSVVGWFFWANDTVGNFNQTSVQNFTVQARPTYLLFSVNQSVYPQGRSPGNNYTIYIPFNARYIDINSGNPIGGAGCYVVNNETTNNVSLSFNETTGNYTGQVDNYLMYNNLTFNVSCSKQNYVSAANFTTTNVWWFNYLWEWENRTFGNGSYTTHWLRKEPANGSLYDRSINVNLSAGETELFDFPFCGSGINCSFMKSYNMLGDKIIRMNVSVNDTSCAPFLCTHLTDFNSNTLIHDCAPQQPIAANTPTLIEGNISANFTLSQNSYIELHLHMNCSSNVSEEVHAYYNYTDEYSAFEIHHAQPLQIIAFLFGASQVENNYTLGPNSAVNITGRLSSLFNNTAAIPQSMNYFLIPPILPQYPNSIVPNTSYIYNSTGQLWASDNASAGAPNVAILHSSTNQVEWTTETIPANSLVVEVGQAVLKDGVRDQEILVLNNSGQKTWEISIFPITVPGAGVTYNLTVFTNYSAYGVPDIFDFNVSRTTNSGTQDITGQISVDSASDTITFPVMNLTDFANFTVTAMDRIPPSINFTGQTPANGSSQNFDYVFINASVTDNVAVSSCLLEWNSTNETMNITGSGASVTCWSNKIGIMTGTYLFKVYANDTAGNTNVSETRSVTITIDNAFPVVTSIFPNNNSITGMTNITFNCSATDNLNLSNISLILNGIANSTNAVSGTSNQTAFNVITANESAYSWYCNATDMSGNQNSSAARTLTINVSAIPSANTSTFSGNTTNWSALPDLSNVCNGTAMLDNPDTDMIVWNGCVNAVGADFNSFVTLMNNNVTVNSSGLNSTFNSSVRITMRNLTWDATPVIFVDGVLCNETTECIDISYNATTGVLSFNATHLSSFISGANSELRIWDETDDNASFLFANQTKYPFQKVRFFANYTRKSDGAPRTGATCAINFTDINTTMAYNSTLLIYEYNRTFNANGTFSWNVTCALTGANTLTLNDTAFITNDTLPPGIALNYPPSGIFTTNTSFDFNWTATDNAYTDLTCNLTINSIVNASNIAVTNNTPANYSVSGLTDGYMPWNVTCWDAMNNTNTSETRNFTVDTIAPNISFQPPTEASGSAIGRNYIIINVTAIDANLQNITIYLYNSSGVLINLTNSTTSQLFVNYTGLADGRYYFNASAHDFASNTNFTETRNVTIDTVFPVVIIYNPVNATTYNTTENLLLEYTATNGVAIDKCWYSLNGGANITLSGCTNTTFNATPGANNITVYANDTVGNTNSSTKFFTALANTTLDLKVLNLDFLNFTENGNITFIGQAAQVISVHHFIPAINYTYINGTPVQNAIVNATIIGAPGVHFSYYGFQLPDVFNTTYDLNVSPIANNSYVAVNFTNTYNNTPATGMSVHFKVCKNSTNAQLGMVRLGTSLNWGSGVDSANFSPSQISLCPALTALELDYSTLKDSADFYLMVGCPSCNASEGYIIPRTNNTNGNMFEANRSFETSTGDSGWSLLSGSSQNYNTILFVHRYFSSFSDFNFTFNSSLGMYIDNSRMYTEDTGTIGNYSADANKTSHVHRSKTEFIENDEPAVQVSINSLTDSLQVHENPSNGTQLEYSDITLSWSAFHPSGIDYFYSNLTYANGTLIAYNDTNFTVIWPKTLFTQVNTIYNLTVWANNTLGNFSSKSIWFYVNDTAVPLVTIYQPNGTYEIAENIPIQFTAVNTFAIDSCWYSLDGAANVSLPLCANTTINASAGNHTIFIYANDSVGNTGYNSSNFTALNYNTTLFLNTTQNPVQSGELFYFLSDYQYMNGSDVLNATCTRQVLNTTTVAYYDEAAFDTLENYSDGHFTAIKMSNIITNVRATNYKIELHLNKVGDVSGKNMYVWVQENETQWNSTMTPAVVINGTSNPEINETNKGIIANLSEDFFNGTQFSKNYTIFFGCPDCNATDFYQAGEDVDNFGRTYESAANGVIMWDNFTITSHQAMAELKNDYKKINETYNSTLSAYVCSGCQLFLHRESLFVYTWNGTCSKQDHINQSALSTVNVSQNFAPQPNITSITPNPAELGIDNVTVNWTNDYTGLAFGINHSHINLSYPNGTFIAHFTGNPVIITPNYINASGTYNLTALAQNAVGSNTSYSNFTVQDTTAPTINFTPPTETSGTVINRDYILINVTASDFSPIANITIYLYNLTGVLVNSTTSSSPNFVNYTNLANGRYYFNATAYDAAGNFNFTETRNVTIDTAGPSVTLNYPPNGFVTSVNSINFNWTAANGQDTNLSCNLTINGTVNASGIASLNNTPTNYSVSGFTEGIRYWNVTCIDDTLNMNTSETRNFTIDTTPPNITIISPVDQNYNNATILVNISAIDLAAGVDSIWYDWNGTNVTYTTPVYVNFTDGSLSLTAYANDTLGNTNSSSVAFTIDTIAPAVQFRGQTETSGSTISRNYTIINVTASDTFFANITVYLYNSTGALRNTSTTTFTSIFVNYTNLADGLYYFNATAYDAFGNRNSTETRNVTIDTAKPSVTIISPIATAYNNTEILVNISVLDNTVVSQTWFSWNGTNVTYTTPVFINFTDNSTITLTAYANDTVNNINFTNVTFIVNTSLVDTTPPAITNITSAATNESAKINWTTNELANSSVNYGTTAALGTASGNPTLVINHSILISPLANGTLYYYNVTSCDFSGNCNTSGPFNFTTQQNVFFNNAPVVNLSKPDNNTQVNNINNITLNFTATDDLSATLSCGLYLNNTLNQTNSSVQNSTLTNFNLNVSLGAYSWLVNCSDGTLSNISETRTFRINDTLAPGISNIANTTTNTSATINWTTDEIANSTVRYGATTAFGSAVYNSSLVFNHSVLIAGLANNTLYYYNITSCDSFGNCNTSGAFNFTTKQNADFTAPTIISYTISPRDPAVGNFTFIDANATDNANLSSIFVNITLPNSTVITSPLPYNYSPAITGRHNVTIFANDSSGNLASVTDYFIAGSVTLPVQINILNNSFGGLPVNLSVFFSGTNDLVENSSFIGEDLQLRTDILYDLLFRLYSNAIYVRLNRINFSIDNNSTLGVDKTQEPGFLVTYGLFANYTFSNAILTINYSALPYSDENLLEVYRCASWNFTGRICTSGWASVAFTIDTVGNIVTINTTGFSAYSIKQGEEEAAPSGGGGGGNTGTSGAPVITKAGVDVITENPIQYILSKDKKLEFKFEDNIYSLVPVEVTTEYIGLRIDSALYRFKVSEQKAIDLDNDGEADIYVSLDKIFINRRIDGTAVTEVYVTLQRIAPAGEIIVVEAEKPAYEAEVPVEEKPAEVPEEAPAKVSVGYGIIVPIAIIIIIAILLLLLWKRSKKKRICIDSRIVYNAYADRFKGVWRRPVVQQAPARKVTASQLYYELDRIQSAEKRYQKAFKINFRKAFKFLSNLLSSGYKAIAGIFRRKRRTSEIGPVKPIKVYAPELAALMEESRKPQQFTKAKEHKKGIFAVIFAAIAGFFRKIRRIFIRKEDKYATAIKSEYSAAKDYVEPFISEAASAIAKFDAKIMHLEHRAELTLKKLHIGENISNIYSAGAEAIRHLEAKAADSELVSQIKKAYARELHQEIRFIRESKRDYRWLKSAMSNEIQALARQLAKLDAEMIKRERSAGKVLHRIDLRDRIGHVATAGIAAIKHLEEKLPLTELRALKDSYAYYLKEEMQALKAQEAYYAPVIQKDYEKAESILSKIVSVFAGAFRKLWDVFASKKKELAKEKRPAGAASEGYAYAAESAAPDVAEAASVIARIDAKLISLEHKAELMIRKLHLGENISNIYSAGAAAIRHLEERAVQSELAKQFKKIYAHELHEELKLLREAKRDYKWLRNAVSSELKEIGRHLAKIDAKAIRAAGISAESLRKIDLRERASHIATAGIAAIRHLEGKLPLKEMSAIKDSYAHHLKQELKAIKAQEVHYEAAAKADYVKAESFFSKVASAVSAFFVKVAGLFRKKEKKYAAALKSEAKKDYSVAKKDYHKAESSLSKFLASLSRMIAGAAGIFSAKEKKYEAVAKREIKKDYAVAKTDYAKAEGFISKLASKAYSLIVKLITGAYRSISKVFGAGKKESINDVMVAEKFLSHELAQIGKYLARFDARIMSAGGYAKDAISRIHAGETISGVFTAGLHAIRQLEKKLAKEEMIHIRNSYTSIVRAEVRTFNSSKKDYSKLKKVIIQELEEIARYIAKVDARIINSEHNAAEVLKNINAGKKISTVGISLFRFFEEKEKLALDYVKDVYVSYLKAELKAIIKAEQKYAKVAVKEYHVAERRASNAYHSIVKYFAGIAAILAVAVIFNALGVYSYVGSAVAMFGKSAVPAIAGKIILLIAVTAIAFYASKAVITRITVRKTRTAGKGAKLPVSVRTAIVQDNKKVVKEERIMPEGIKIVKREASAGPEADSKRKEMLSKLKEVYK